MFPVFGRARENARRSSCQSNLKQINLGFNQYTQDYDEKFPPASIDLNGGGFNSVADKGWVEILQPYLKSTQIFQCPSETNAPDTTGGTTAGYTDYFYNYMLGPVTGGISEAAVENTTLCILDADGVSYTSNYAHDGGTTVDALATFVSTQANLQRHLEGANYGFVDGHVKWIKGDSVISSAKIYNGYQSAANKAQRISFTP